MMWTDVKMFMNACDQGISDENAKLYLNLIKEEFEELMQANVENNDIERLDGCMDLIWVTIGYCLAKGYNIRGAWEEVANSNIKKIDSLTGKVIKDEKGKVMKPKDWAPPNLKPFV